MTHVLTEQPLRLAGRALRTVGQARIYVCGVTPYDVTHLGHAATFVWVDTLVRVLRRTGVAPVVCRNITDLDEDLLHAAEAAGATYDSFAAVNQFRFDHDMAALGVRAPQHQPRARTHVEQVVMLARALVENGSAYADATGVHLPGRAIGEDEPDVTVWSPGGPGGPAWPSPWGPGRPGWHAECAAMALDVLGPAIDILAGGSDLAHPHHAAQVALAEAATGVTPFARAQFHVGTVGLSGAKMAKSTGNLVLVSDLLARHSPAAIRMLLLDRPYDTPWEFVESDVAAAAARAEALFAAAARPGSADAPVNEVVLRLLDDLDVTGATQVALEAGGEAAREAIRLLGLA
ncbi:MAG: cysteine--tRNA ligase [Actinomycetes bacterium]